MSDTLTIKFWGVRGSHPVSGANTVQFGGNTPCVEVTTGAQTIILDAGTGAVGLGRELLRRARQQGKPVQAALFFSHLHHDHTQGYPFFAPAFDPTTRLNLFAPGIYPQTLEQVLQAVMTPPAFPVQLNDQGALKTFYNIYERNRVILTSEKVIVSDGTYLPSRSERHAVTVRMLRSYAHPGGVANYRIDWRGLSVVYATDTEGYVDTDRRLANFARGADVLIHDAQYSDEHYCGQMVGLPSTQGWGHSTAHMAIGVAKAAGVGQLVLFHHDPNYDDDMLNASQDKARQSFANACSAYEGLEIRLAAPAVSTKSLQPARARTPSRLQHTQLIVGR